MIENLTIGIPKNVLNRVHSPELEKFERITGIKKTRRFDGTTFEMISNLLHGSHYTHIDAVIVVTQSPDRLSPCLAAQVHAYLDLPHYVPAFDVNHACDGWVFGVWLASCLSRRTLLICADRLRYAPNPIEALMFSDSVTATIIRPRPSTVRFYTDGSRANDLYAGLNGEMHMDGSKVFDFVTTEMPLLIKDWLACDLLVPHQANLSMLKILEKRSGYEGRCLYSIEEYGNQSMNSIPTAIAMNEDAAAGKRLLLAGFGAGYTATLMALEWPRYLVSEIVDV